MSSGVLCPQCHQGIDDIRTDEYAVGWCEKDVHLECFPLHVRSCKACRPYNAEFILHCEQNSGTGS